MMQKVNCKIVEAPVWEKDGEPLQADELHVWKLNIRQLNSIATHQLLSLLDASEMERMQRFVHAEDAQRYMAGRGLLKVLLAKYSTIAPHLIKLSISSNGKPYLQDNSLQLQFNLSHTSDIVLLVFGLHEAVGVDVEAVKNDPMHLDIAKSYFSRAEQKQLLEEYKPDYFFRCWTRREALLKANGSGLVDGLEELYVTEGAHWLSGSGKAVQSLKHQQYQLWSLEPEPGYLATICTAGDAKGLKFMDATSSLLGQLKNRNGCYSIAAV